MNKNEQWIVFCISGGLWMLGLTIFVDKWWGFPLCTVVAGIDVIILALDEYCSFGICGS